MEKERLHRKIRARVFRLVCLCVLLISQTAWAQDANMPPEFIHYDYLDEHMVLKGGIIKVGPDSPMHSKPMAVKENQILQQITNYNVVTIINNGPVRNRVDLVFLGDGYTAGELNDYNNAVNAVIAAFFAEPPFSEFAPYFNVHRVDVVSNQSGVPLGSPGDTALEMYYDWTGEDYRALVVNIDRAWKAAGQAPDWDQTLALANSERYGGSGYIEADVATAADANQTNDTALHELGHSFANLDDEYFSEPTEVYNGSDTLFPGANTSTYDSQEMSAYQIKWYRWLGVPTVPPEQGPIGAYLGATVWNETRDNYVAYRSGVYRPTDWSKMRALGVGDWVWDGSQWQWQWQPYPFCSVNTEQFVLEIYKIVNPIDDATPEGSYPTTAKFSVTPLRPVGRNLDVQWYLDGSVIPGATGTKFDASTLGLPPGGIYTLEVKVVDNTPLVRDESRRPTGARQWTLALAKGSILFEYYWGTTNLLSSLLNLPTYPNRPDLTEWRTSLEGPTDWRDSYGTRVRGYLYPPATGAFTFWIASDDQSELWLSPDEDASKAVRIASVPWWTPPRDFDNTGGGAGGPQQRSSPIRLAEGQRYYIQVLHAEGTFGDNLAVAWQGPGIPTRAVIEGKYLAPVTRGNIIWVSDAHQTIAGSTVPDDQGWVDLLRSEGYTVDYQPPLAPTTGYWQTLDASKLAALDAADLVIVSRDANSGNHATDAAEVTQWNSARTPLILLNVYLARSNRWLWVNSTAMGERLAYFSARAIDRSHPVFASVNLDIQSRVTWLDQNVAPGYSSCINTADAGNGKIIAARPDNNYVLIAEWAAGVPFYSGSTQTPGGKRMLFSAGTQETVDTAIGWGVYDLTAEGQKMFLNAVAYMLGQASP